MDTGGQKMDINVHINHALNQQREILSEILAKLSTTNTSISVSNTDRRVLGMDDFPVPGTKRLHVGRPGYGAVVDVPDNTMTAVIGDNPHRLGGQITVTASTILVLATFDEVSSVTSLTGQAHPMILVSDLYGWDFKLGDVLWTGPVCAFATAAQTAFVAEV